MKTYVNITNRTSMPSLDTHYE